MLYQYTIINKYFCTLYINFLLKKAFYVYKWPIKVFQEKDMLKYAEIRLEQLHTFCIIHEKDLKTFVD